ncbi:hypothetical protein PM082_011562 [Marasmius tenuissimus]|nr:hypothetical protein PM082_011562 [Marasmius tenuissimus]
MPTSSFPERLWMLATHVRLRIPDLTTDHVTSVKSRYKEQRTLFIDVSLPRPRRTSVPFTGGLSNVGVLKREKSKLLREERIALVKKARESGKRLSDLGIQLPVMMDEHCESAPKMERWGPGGEVVQELKDVIWKVGERRRKMTDGLGHVGPPLLRPGDVR